MVKGRQKDWKFSPRVNDDIKYHEARVIYEERGSEDRANDFNKVMRVSDARRLAESMGLDLIEINGKTIPPILRIDDCQKYSWEQKRNARKNKNHATETKEIQLSVSISRHDMETKAKRAVTFLGRGKHVRVVLTMRGRELTRREESSRSFYEFLALLGDGISYVSSPRDEGNKLAVTIKSKK